MSGSNLASEAARIPSATYRLQFTRTFGFRQATAILDYLHQLGISDVYASPLFKTATESTHGYDVCDYNQIHPALGSPDEFDAFIVKLKSLGMGLLLDIVPNHMRADASNAWWKDVLEHGRTSQFAGHFDIDWDSPHARNKVLLPVLEAELGEVLQAGKLQLAFERGAFVVRYYDKSFPVAGQCYEKLLRDLRQHLKETAATRLIDDVLADTRKSPPGMAAWESIKNRLSAAETAPAIQAAVSAVCSRINSPQLLASLLGEQHYVLHYWKTGLQRVNYRRFFDVSDLVCVNMHRPEVFEVSHRFMSGLLRDQKITGLRVDHPDGLRDPQRYFEQLPRSTYVVAEKILSDEESLPSNWAVAGTTGYDFLNRLNGLFVNGEAREAFDRLYARFTGAERDFGKIVYESKKRILQLSFQSETAALVRQLKQIAELSTAPLAAELEPALTAVIAAFPVYRTYITEASERPSPIEREYIEQAIHQAKEREPNLDSAALTLIEKQLLLDVSRHPEVAETSMNFVMKFQQLTGPVTAKGVEDTAFYVFNRFISLNEVGGAPGRFGITLQEFHSFNQQRAKDWPHALSATATHDTKRGEDVRARLNVISELPGEWAAAIENWREINAGKKQVVAGESCPDANDEYLIYQTLAGTMEEGKGNQSLLTSAATKSYVERITAYMMKAIREAKRHTTWTEPNPEYEAAVARFVEQALGDETFLTDFRRFQRRVAYFGQFNSYSQTLLKITCPGVPDFYQGTELWDLALVDPDNRRPVDFGQREKALARVNSPGADRERVARITTYLTDAASADLKLFIICTALVFRRQHPGLFSHGDYLSLEVGGEKARHACALSRRHGAMEIVTVVPRLPVSLTGGVERAPLGRDTWRDTFLHLPKAQTGETYRDIFTGEPLVVCNQGEKRGLFVGDILSRSPVSLLFREKVA